jgi:hypothetical protein
VSAVVIAAIPTIEQILRGHHQQTGCGVDVELFTSKNRVIMGPLDLVGKFPCHGFEATARWSM